MTSSLPPFWEAGGLPFSKSAWIREENPDFEVVAAVVAWVTRLIDNPYLGGGVRELSIAPNLWWARVPGTDREGASVHCSYWIDEEIRQIRCDQIATLST